MSKICHILKGRMLHGKKQNTLVLPIPRFGIDFSLGRSSEGIWLFQPWRVMCLGFLHFTTIGLLELFYHPATDAEEPTT